MSGLSASAENNLMLLIFNNTNWANVGDAVGVRGSTVAGSFYVGLATAALTDASTQLTSESAYTGYGRQAVARSGAGWLVSGSSPTQAANVAAITYGICIGAAPETQKYFCIGRDAAGAGEILWWGQLTADLIVNLGITPQFAIGACVATLN